MIEIFAELGWIQALALAAVFIAPMVIFGALAESVIRLRSERKSEVAEHEHERKTEKMKLDHEVDSVLLTADDEQR